MTMLLALVAASASPALPAQSTNAPTEAYSSHSYRLDTEDTEADAIARYRKTRKTAVRWELAYQVLNLADMGQTIAHCSRVPRADRCEANPLYGRHPSTGKLVGIKLATGLLHGLVFKHILDRDAPKALRFAKVGVFVQGAVVGANMRVFF